jgi:apolipoprotein N-acyltransferase
LENVRNVHRSAWLLAGTSGVLQVLIFPLPNLFWLCWVALAPLLVAVLRARADEPVNLPATLGEKRYPATPLQGFLLGWVAGIIWSAGTCDWIYHVMHIYGGLPAPVAAGVLVLFCLALGAHIGVFTLGMALIANSSGKSSIRVRRALVLAPFLWVGVEFARTRITGFPWNLLGTVQVDNIPLTRLATVTGVYGLSCEIMLVNAAFAGALLARRQGRKLLLVSAIFAAAALQLSVLVHPPRLAAQGTARLVQPAIPLMQEWSRPVFLRTMNALRQQSQATTAESEGQRIPDLIVWPESPAPFYVNDPLFRGMMTQMARETHAYLIVGALGVNHQPPGRPPQQVFNSAALIAPDGEWMARYDKIHLVPFGEYVPFKALLSFARQLTAEVGDFIPGSKRSVFDLGRYKAGVFICYESIFPAEVAEFAANGAQLFVNISNDEWFGRSAAPEQHLNQARMRAIENNRWLLRGTNTGITASIDPLGRIVESAPRDVLTAVDVPFSIVTGTTFYTRHRDWFCWVCVIISVAAWLAGIPGVRRRISARR